MRTIHLIGLNYKSASVEIRERFALSEFCTPENWLITNLGDIEESLILSTCNRVEILFCCECEDSVTKVLELWAQAKSQELKDLLPFVYHFKNAEAVSHLFKVAGSLDSLVLGEPQILGQLKKAYNVSVEAKQAKLIINKLLHKAFFVAKRVRSETQVANNAVSISYAAVELTKRIFDDMQDKEAMLIGAGEMAELAAMHLIQAGVQKIYIANRTKQRAIDLAQTIHSQKCEAIEFDELIDYLERTDIIISQTGSSELILNAKDIKNVVKKRKNKAMFFIDIAVPRDIDPDVNNLDNVYLYDIDDLKEVVEENLASRRGEADKAHLIVASETQSFLQWLDELELQPCITALIGHTEKIVREEFNKTLKKIAPLSKVDSEAFEAMINAITKKIDHHAIVYLKNNKEHKDQAIQHIHDVFKF